MSEPIRVLLDDLNLLSQDLLKSEEIRFKYLQSHLVAGRFLSIVKSNSLREKNKESFIINNDELFIVTI